MADSIQQQTPSFALRVYFDGDCPLCSKEIALLRKLDRQSRISFVDIAAPEFSAEALGTTQEKLMSAIQAQLPDESWIEGVEVFRRLYGALGFGVLVRITRWPGISHLLDFVYRYFAKNRLRFTGRCDTEVCSV